MKKFTGALSIIVFAASLAIAIPVHTAEQEGQTAAKVLSGQVAAVDSAASKIVIKDKEGKEVSLIVDTNTRITKGGKDVALADVKPGEMATAECQESDAGLKALKITIAQAE